MNLTQLLPLFLCFPYLCPDEIPARPIKPTIITYIKSRKSNNPHRPESWTDTDKYVVVYTGSHEGQLKLIRFMHCQDNLELILVSMQAI